MVTLLGMVTLVRLVQPRKACCPILVTLLGMFMLVRLVQFKKTFSSIVVKTLPESLRFTYLPAEFITSAILGSISTLALIVTFIGLSGPLAGFLSRYALKSSALLMGFPSFCIKQDVVERTNNINNDKKFSLEKKRVSAIPFVPKISLVNHAVTINERRMNTKILRN